MPNGTLYLVPTPIGNLEDITLRALRILNSVDSIICEDTRQTVKLLNHFEIKKPLVSFFTYNQLRRIPEIIKDIASGKNFALVSDSGMPGISDPGCLLVEEVLKHNIQVVPLPGPNAALTALIASGLPTHSFIFLGFLRKKSGKIKKELARAAESGCTVIFYESPYRVRKTLALCAEIFPPSTRVVLARELTKIYEEFTRGTLEEVNIKLKEKEPKGEFVVLLNTCEDEREDENEPEETMVELS
jgi:16S rRNA (cytidine1402-2'-O)-methyltransferase